MAAGHGNNTPDMSASFNYNFLAVAADEEKVIEFPFSAGPKKFLVTAIGADTDTLGIQLNTNEGEYFRIPTNRTVEIPCGIKRFLYLKNMGSAAMDISVMVLRTSF